MAKLRHITFTGVDANTNLMALQDIQSMCPIVEFGVLTSYHWYDNGRRYLNPEFMSNLSGCGLNLALHICGSAAHDAAVGDWEKIDELTCHNLRLFNRIQLNISGRKDNPEYCETAFIDGQEIIIQQRCASKVDLFENTQAHWPFAIDKFSTLLDASGGRDIDTPIEVLKTKEKVGYAGGINPDNVGDKLRCLLQNPDVGDFWIDMESGVRTDDWFDTFKIREVLYICHEVLGEF